MAAADEDLDIEAAKFAGWPRRPRWRNPLGLPAPLTWKQCFYIWGPQCIGAACIDGAANFAIAYGMYSTANRRITLWVLAENTLLGDTAVTTFIQGILTFVLSSALVHVDLRLKRVDPLPYPWPDQSFGVVRINGPEKATTRHGRLWRTFHNKHGLGRGLHFFSGSDVQDIFDTSLTAKQFFTRLFWSVWKGSVLSALFFFPWWAVCVAILAPIYRGSDLRGTWVPEVTKLIYGFTLGLVMTPIVAAIALGSEDAIRLHLRDGQKAAWKADDEKFAPVTNSERKAPRPSLEVHSRKPSTIRDSRDGHPASPTSAVGGMNESLSTDVAALRRSLDTARTPVDVSRRSSLDRPRSSMDAARRSQRVSLDLPPSRPSFDRAPSEGSLADELRPPRPSLERRRTAPGRAKETPRSLSLDLAKSRLEQAVNEDLAGRRSPSQASPAKPRASIELSR